MYATGALTRLAKETSPWVALPKELSTGTSFWASMDLSNRNAVSLSLGRSVLRKWATCRAKVVRRPPPQLKGSYVTVLCAERKCI